MHKPSLALPVSQHFDDVFPHLSDIVEVLSVYNIDSLPCDFASYPYRKTFHTNGLVNTHFADEITEDLISFLNICDVFHMSFDCGPSCLDVCFNPEENNCYWPAKSSETLNPEEIIEIAKDRIKFIKSCFHGTIALENLDYHHGGAYEHVCSPSFITNILKELDVFFTIDIAHVLVTSANLGMDPSKYISDLPLELVREVHLSHPEGGNDKHLCPTSYEYDLLEYVLANSAPEFILLEYYQEPNKIVEENIKLYEFLNRNIGNTKNKEMV